MIRVSIRARYVGEAPGLYGKTGWTHRPVQAPADAWEFQADDGARVPCNRQDVTVWLGGSWAANAA